MPARPAESPAPAARSDLRAVAPAVLRHRVNVAPELELEGVTADQALKAILDRIEAPTA